MLLSRIIDTIFMKAVSVLALYIIDTIRPEMICSIRIIPNIKPKFHMYEIDFGVGKSSRDFFTRFVIGFWLINWLFIKMK